MDQVCFLTQKEGLPGRCGLTRTTPTRLNRVSGKVQLSPVSNNQLTDALSFHGRTGRF